MFRSCDTGGFAWCRVLGGVLQSEGASTRKNERNTMAFKFFRVPGSVLLSDRYFTRLLEICFILPPAGPPAPSVSGDLSQRCRGRRSRASARNDNRGRAFPGPGQNSHSTRSHKAGCLLEEVGVPSYSTHWMGLNTTPTCDSWQVCL